MQDRSNNQWGWTLLYGFLSIGPSFTCLLLILIIDNDLWIVFSSMDCNIVLSIYVTLYIWHPVTVLSILDFIRLVSMYCITFPHFDSLSTRHWSLRLCASSLRFRTDFWGGLNFLINLLRQFLFGSLIYFLPLGVREWEKVWNLCSGLWLVRTDHVTLSMASDWSRQRVSDCRTPAECYTSNWGKQQNTGLESILTTYFQIAASMSWLRVTLI